MKTKTHIISNFKFNPINNNDNILIKEMFNVNFDTGNLSSELSCENILNLYFTPEIILQIKQKNPEIILQIKQFIPYEFYSDDYKIIERIFILTINNKFYELNFQNLEFVEIYNFSLEPQIIFQENYLYLFDKNNNCLVIQNSNIPQIEKIPTVTNFINLNNKSFFTYKNYPIILFETNQCEIIHLSENIEQYSQHKINLDNGDILNIFTLKNKLYILTQYSIYYYDIDNNSFNKILSTNLKINKNCIQQIDNSLIFLSLNSLYLFDGIDLKLLTNSLQNTQENANLVCFNRNLYIFDLSFADFIYKINTTNFSITPIKISKLNNLYLIKNIKHYALCINTIEDDACENFSLYENKNNQLYQKIIFKPFDFNSTFNKTIKSINLNLEGECELIISSNYSDNYIFKIKDNTQLNNINIYGSIFYFEILSEKYFNLESILIFLEEES